MSVFERSTEGRFGTLLESLREEIAEAVRLYWDIASDILADSGVRLQELSPDFLALRRNFFSVLFIYSYHRAGIPKSRRVLYAALNHCLRGMVTGCDNLLDDEYKPTLLTDLPETGTRFRSVLDIMVSDRVLFRLLLDSLRLGDISVEQVVRACSESMRVLARSGAQEAGEEEGIHEILEPRQLLRSIHHFKTGLLFQSPWAIPKLIEPPAEDGWASILEALYNIGIGCQIMDDMVDMASDIKTRRHNYLVSLIYHGDHEAERSRLSRDMEQGAYAEHSGELVCRFPHALGSASRKARSFLRKGLAPLFAQDLQSFVHPAIEILSELIGASRFMIGEDDRL